jgi:hypothetical protein
MAGTAKKVRDGQILTVSEVALLLGVHINTVKRLPPSDLPYFTVGHRNDRRYYRADIDVYIEDRAHRE